ncbi:hypothetical protein ACE6H2_020733 [Prunus campanulata]
MRDFVLSTVLNSSLSMVLLSKYIGGLGIKLLLLLDLTCADSGRFWGRTIAFQFVELDFDIYSLFRKLI